MVGLILGRVHLGAKGVAVLRGGGLQIRDGDGDMVQTADHGRLRGWFAALGLMRSGGERGKGAGGRRAKKLGLSGRSLPPVRQGRGLLRGPNCHRCPMPHAPNSPPPDSPTLPPDFSSPRARRCFVTGGPIAPCRLGADHGADCGACVDERLGAGYAAVRGHHSWRWKTAALPARRCA